MRIKNTKATPDLQELRTRFYALKEEGERMCSNFVAHAKKMEEYYSDWEDRLNAIQEEINKLEKDYGIGAEEIIEYDLTQDLALLQ